MRDYMNKPAGGAALQIKHTICDICNPMTHCGIDAHIRDGKVVKVEGTPGNPHSMGRLCVKGAASRQYIYNSERLLTPMRQSGERGSGGFEALSWDKALDLAGERLKDIAAKYGPESVAFFVGYPKWMRPFVKRLAHSFGSPNFLTESSTCSTAVSLAHWLNYGSFAGPDIPNAKCLLAWSANPFYSNAPAAGKLMAARQRGLKIIEVGPMLTPMTKHADIHLRMRPGTSGALALALANVIISEDLYDHEFVARWTVGFPEYKAYAAQFGLERAAGITGVAPELIQAAARLYAQTKPAAILTGAGATVQHTNGLQNTRALSSLIGLCGNYDQKGGNVVTPHSFLEASGGIVTREAEFSQPKAWDQMAPRVGLADFPLWCQAKPQAHALALADQIIKGEPYPIKAVVGFGLNFRMWPGSDHMARALGELDYFVNVDLFHTDTTRMADMVLPACSSFERSELKILPGNFAIYTKPVIEPLGESRSDADIACDLAKRICPEDELLSSGHRACLEWMLEPSALSLEELEKHPKGMVAKPDRPMEFKKYEKQGFKTPSGKMEFYSEQLARTGQEPLPHFKEPELSPVSRPELAKDFPLILTTGARLPMYLHSRTYRVPWLRRLRPDPMVDINPADARERNIAKEQWVTLSTPKASVRVRANLTKSVPPGVVSLYHGNSQADANLLIEHSYRDPVSGFPGFKSLICQVAIDPGEDKQS